MVVLDLALVAHHLAIELVDQLIYGRIEISVGTLGKHVVALDADIAFGTLPTFLFLLVFHCQQNAYIDYLVEMPRNSIQLARYVIAKRRRNVEMVTADRQVHE
eukprot:TRINITY_DN38067_c0_g1_i1.p2 TRINITY_DN38067_c0_g1~~TRINITY_DN38067_c0_g1_i1.p2  ORF type:complete len:103 (+),score=20.40 TRINITY_DN38067_c0_g1_i1:68-376(+)